MNFMEYKRKWFFYTGTLPTELSMQIWSISGHGLIS
jgi:hypothetical protein